MRRVTRAASNLSVLLWLGLAMAVGCTGTSNPDDDDSSPADDDDTAPPPDLSSGTWQQELIHAAGDMPVLGLALPEDAAPMAVWEEAGGIEIGRREQDQWHIESLPHPEPTDYYGSPALIAADGTLHMAHSVYQADASEWVAYRRNTGGGWEDPVDVTAEDPDLDWIKFSPALSLDGAGQPLVGYASQFSVSPEDNDSRVRLVHLSGGVTTAPPTLVLDAPDNYCWANSVLQDHDGVDYLLALCIPAAGDPYHVLAHNLSGTWETQEFTGGAQGHLGELALDPDGVTVHMVWELAVPFGAQILYAQVEQGVIGPEVLVVEGAGLFDFRVGPHARPLVLAGGNGVLSFLHSADGGETFSETQFTFSGGDWPWAGALAIEPETALPRFVFNLIDGETMAADITYAIYEID
jgi:hypothetical protein